LNELQSLFWVQLEPLGQVTQTLPPQSTSASPWFWMPSLQLGAGTVAACA
jgi:hypothetical protein